MIPQIGGFTRAGQSRGPIFQTGQRPRHRRPALNETAANNNPTALFGGNRADTKCMATKCMATDCTQPANSRYGLRKVIASEKS